MGRRSGLPGRNGSIALATSDFGYSTIAYPTLATARFPRPLPSDAGVKLLGWLIWVPTILIFSMLWMSELRLLAILVAAAGVGFHSIMNTRVAVYGLILAILFEHIIGTGISWFSLSKMMGVWAFVVSTPKILRAIGNQKPMDPLAKWILLFVMMGFLSTMLSPEPAFSLKMLLTMILIYSLPLLVNVNVVEWQHYRMAMIVLIAGGLVLAAQFIKGGGSAELASWERYGAESVLGEAHSEVNEVARLMGMGAFSTIFLFFITKRFLWKPLCIGAGVLLCIGVVMTQSRACYVAIPLATVIGIWFVRRVGMTARLTVTGTAVGLTVLIFVLGTMVGFAGTAIEKRLASIFDPEDIGGRGIRFQLWEGYTKSSLRRGMVVGYGLYTTQLDPVNRQYGAIGSAHSDVFHILGDLGIFGLAFFIGIHACLVRRIFRINPWRQQYVAWMLWLFLIICGVFETDFMRKCYGLGLALILVMIRLSEQDEEDYRWACAEAEYYYSQEQAELPSARAS
jgi:hypothetical protein